MAEPYLGEIRLVAFGVVIPRGWLACAGQLLSVQQNQALFSLLGTMYGGDGKQTFGLPDLRGRTPVHLGSATDAPDPGEQGFKGGFETVALTTAEIPAHRHDLNAVSTAANTQLPTGALISSGATDDQLLFGPSADLVALNIATIANQGGGVAHENMQPYRVLQYIIANSGIYPTRP
jgi:microcystin-dependent protein